MSRECGQVAKELAVLTKDWLQHVRHREANAGIGNVGKGSPLVTLPTARA